jgi:hypothetical protein
MKLLVGSSVITDPEVRQLAKNARWGRERAKVAACKYATRASLSAPLDVQ